MKCNVFSMQCFCPAHAQMTLLESNIAKTLHFISLVVDARFAHPMNTENYLNFFNQLMIQSINRVFLGWLTHRQTQTKNYAANNGKTTVTPKISFFQWASWCLRRRIRMHFRPPIL